MLDTRHTNRMRFNTRLKAAGAIFALVNRNWLFQHTAA